MRQKLLFLTCAILLLTGLWLVMKPDSGSLPNSGAVAEAKEFYFTIQSGSIPDPQVIQLKIGDTAQLNFMSDSDAAVHIHGVDMHIVLNADVTQQVKFDATQAGRFALEVHDTEMQLGAIEVYPR
ncbi:hypothetical protein [Zhongshania arctica]|uniref:EfeO-type cupredoxin-like domain-containing protein n=1 Tax=Zhongshania arctica TaxID=3238302 RepID=A0ABV3TSW9_9GAMM|tara:strand:- start:4084 stop:4458 length:375 start_codon:yes stop_codon:yes gene_type:complete